MRLFIAEKPDLAKAIVDGLGGGSRKDGFYDCGNDYVTWCYGHMLQLLDPEDYDPRYGKWNMDDLPISHIPWQKKPSGDKKDQLKIITNLLKQADSIVHAGDPDDEGQLLVDEILTYAACNLPVMRLLINDNNISVVKRSLANMRDNREFASMSAAAEARSVGDQLYGYNMSRAYTLAASKVGYQGVLSVGRVQTPIVGLVVEEIENLKHIQKAITTTLLDSLAFTAWLSLHVIKLSRAILLTKKAVLPIRFTLRVSQIPLMVRLHRSSARQLKRKNSTRHFHTTF